MKYLTKLEIHIRKYKEAEQFTMEKEDAEGSNNYTKCQGCGTQEAEFQCTECDEMFCSQCIAMDHTENRHMCLNCEIESDSEEYSKSGWFTTTELRFGVQKKFRLNFLGGPKFFGLNFF